MSLPFLREVGSPQGEVGGLLQIYINTFFLTPPVAFGAGPLRKGGLETPEGCQVTDIIF